MQYREFPIGHSAASNKKISSIQKPLLIERVEQISDLDKGYLLKLRDGANFMRGIISGVLESPKMGNRSRSIEKSSNRIYGSPTIDQVNEYLDWVHTDEETKQQAISSALCFSVSDNIRQAISGPEKRPPIDVIWKYIFTAKHLRQKYLEIINSGESKDHLEEKGLSVDSEKGVQFFLQNEYLNYLRILGILPKLDYDIIHQLHLYAFTKTNKHSGLSDYIGRDMPRDIQDKDIFTFGPGKGNDEFFYLSLGAKSLTTIDISDKVMSRLSKIKKSLADCKCKGFLPDIVHGIIAELFGDLNLTQANLDEKELIKIIASRLNLERKEGITTENDFLSKIGDRLTIGNNGEPQDVFAFLDEAVGRGEKVDVCIANSVVQYFNNKELEELLLKLNGYTRDGGLLAFGVKTFGSLFEQSGISLYSNGNIRSNMFFDGQMRFIRRGQELKAIFAKAGFKVVEIRDSLAPGYEMPGNEQYFLHIFAKKVRDVGDSDDLEIEGMR